MRSRTQRIGIVCCLVWCIGLTSFSTMGLERMRVEAGAEIYAQRCASCHGENLVWGLGSQAENSRHAIFSFNPISLFDLKAHFFVPTHSVQTLSRARGCQGWPSLKYLLMLRRCQATP